MKLHLYLYDNSPTNLTFLSEAFENGEKTLPFNKLVVSLYCIKYFKIKVDLVKSISRK